MTQFTRQDRDASIQTYDEQFKKEGEKLEGAIEAALQRIFADSDNAPPEVMLARLQMISAFVTSIAYASAADIQAGRVQITSSQPQPAAPTNALALGGPVDKEHELARRLKDDTKFARLVAAFEDDPEGVLELVESFTRLDPSDKRVVLKATEGINKTHVANPGPNTITRPRTNPPAQPASSGTTTSGGASSQSSAQPASGSSNNPVPASGVVGHKPVATQANSGGQSGQQTGNQGTPRWQTGPNDPNTTTAPMPPVPAAPATPASGKGNGRRGNG